LATRSTTTPATLSATALTPSTLTATSITAPFAPTAIAATSRVVTTIVHAEGDVSNYTRRQS